MCVPLLDLDGLHLICGLGAYFLVLLNEVSVSGHRRGALALPEGSSVIGLVALARVTHPKDLAGKQRRVSLLLIAAMTLSVLVLMFWLVLIDVTIIGIFGF